MELAIVCATPPSEVGAIVTDLVLSDKAITTKCRTAFAWTLTAFCWTPLQESKATPAANHSNNEILDCGYQPQFKSKLPVSICQTPTPASTLKKVASLPRCYWCTQIRPLLGSWSCTPSLPPRRYRTLQVRRFRHPRITPSPNHEFNHLRPRTGIHPYPNIITFDSPS